MRFAGGGCRKSHGKNSAVFWDFARFFRGHFRGRVLKGAATEQAYEKTKKYMGIRKARRKASVPLRKDDPRASDFAKVRHVGAGAGVRRARGGGGRRIFPAPLQKGKGQKEKKVKPRGFAFSVGAQRLDRGIDADMQRLYAFNRY